MAYSDEEAFLKAFQIKAGIDITKPENAWVKSVYNVAKKYIDSNMVAKDDTGELYNYILLDTESPELAPFRARFSAYLNERSKAIAAGGVPVWSNVGEYLTTEKDYMQAIKSKPGFADLATIDNVKKFIEGGNSVSEINSRIDEAFYAVQTADAALKEQLQTYYPSLSDADLAKALITGSTTDVEQKVKIASAGIKAEQKLAGITEQIDTAELARKGVTREAARTGFQKVAQEQQGIQQAARRFGRTAPTQEELTQEALGLKASSSAKSLRSQARAEFAGGTGIQTGSLRRKSTGSSQL